MCGRLYTCAPIRVSHSHELARVLVRHTMGAYREGQKTTLPWEKEDIREDDVNMTSGATFAIFEIFSNVTSV